MPQRQSRSANFTFSGRTFRYWHGLPGKPSDVDLVLASWTSTAVPTFTERVRNGAYVEWTWDNSEVNRDVTVRVFVGTDHVSDDLTVVGDFEIPEADETFTYGLSTAATPAENQAALNTAIARAMASSKLLVLPEGTFEIDLQQLASPGTGCFYITADLTIRGAGKGITKLKGMNMGATATLFYIASGINLTLEDMTLEGPASLTYTDPGGDDAPVCFGAFHAGGGGTLKGRNIHTTKWNQAIKMDGGGVGGICRLSDCHIQSRGMGILHIEGSDATTATIDCERTIFEQDSDGFIVAGALNPSAVMHNLYINKGVSGLFRGCTFKKAANYGLIWFGGSLIARYCIVQNCIFENNHQRGVLAHSATTTQILGCTFFGNATVNQHITLQGGYVEILGNKFHWSAGSGQSSIIDDQGVATSCLISGNSFNKGGGAFGGNLISHIETDNTKPWIITGNQFFDTNASYAPLLLVGRNIIENNDFYTTNVTGGTCALRLRTGNHTVKDNRWHTVMNSPIIIEAVGGAVTANLHGRNESITGTGSIYLAVTGGACTVNHEGLRFPSGTGFDLGSGTNPTNFSGWGKLPPGINSHAIASGVITLAYIGDTIVMNTGSTPNITDIQFTGANAGAHNNVMWDGVEVTMIAQQAFTLKHNAGATRSNIYTSSGADLLVPANASVRLVWNSTLAVWLEVW